MLPAKFRARSAWRVVGLTAFVPFPWASPYSLRRAAMPFTTEKQPLRICLKICSVWLAGLRFKALAAPR